MQRLPEARRIKIILQSIFPSSDFLRSACFHHHLLKRPHSELYLCSKIYQASVKLTFVRKPNATHRSVPLHKVSSNSILFLEHNKENKNNACTTTHSRLWFEHCKFRIRVKQSTPTYRFYENGILA